MRGFRLFAPLIFVLLWAMSALASPTLTTLPAPDNLKSKFQTGQTYTLHLEYKDPDGFKIKSAKFHDRSKDGEPSFDAESLGGNTENGVPLTWKIAGFAKGDHAGWFEVIDEKGTVTRFPEDKNANYSFVVESITDKWIVMVVGILICLGMLPFLVYLIARATNKQGNPSAAARVGLIIGIFAALALFIYEFMSIYDPLVLVLGGIAAVFLLVVVLVRR